MGTGLSQEAYVRQVLEAYRNTPGTMGMVRRADRLLAAVRCTTSWHDSLAGVLPAGD